jgi:enoyl-CoA hydratase/carnithine racemase
MLQAPVSVSRSSIRPISVRPEAGVRVEDVGPIRKVTIDRPSRKNAITPPMYEMLTAALAGAAASDVVDVLLIASSGGPFSAGTDLSDFWDASPTAADRDAFARAAATFVRTLASFPKPIVAAVGGLALGMGATIVLHCDLVVAAQTAAFEFSFARAAPEPEGGSSVLLAASVGLQRASEWLLFGERIDAETALRAGLVNAVVPRGELMASALARAEAIATLPQDMVRETKRRLRLAMPGMADESHRLGLCGEIERPASGT